MKNLQEWTCCDETTKLDGLFQDTSKCFDNFKHHVFWICSAYCIVGACAVHLRQREGFSSVGQSATSKRRNESLFSPLLPAATWSGNPSCAVRWSSRGEVYGVGSVSGVLAQVLSVFHLPLPLFGELSYCVWCTRRYFAAAEGGEIHRPVWWGPGWPPPGSGLGKIVKLGFFVVRFRYCFSCEVHIVVMLTELCKFGLFTVLKGIIGSVMWARGGKTDVHVHVAFSAKLQIRNCNCSVGSGSSLLMFCIHC